MKTYLALLLVFTVGLASAQNGVSTITADGPSQQDIEVIVDGKSYTIIPASVRQNASGHTFQISNLSAGQHVILFKPISTEDSGAVSPKVTTTATPQNNMVASGPLPNRINIIQRQIYITPAEKDSIKVALYDNGYIDNDTVSLYRDNRAIAQNRMLTGKPLVFYTSFEKGQVRHVLKMEAKNLGTIAPNTALMIVTTSKARYMVPLSGDLEKNAVVELILKQ
jgi:hypothetical protein